MSVIPEPGALVDGRYRIGERIGSGAMAEVFEAHDERLDRTVAIKRFRARPEDRARFESEMTLLASLQHRNIVGLYDAGGFDDVPYVVLERCAGTLDDRLRAGPMTLDEVTTVGTDLAEALAAVHGAGMVHRDVKPSNVLLADDGRALLGDFGIARLLDATRLTDAAMTIGTLAYFAPEQAAGGDVGPPADVYALGLVLLEALTGRRAFEGSQQELLAARLLRDPEVPATLPPSWRELLTVMTARAPGDRPTAAGVAATIAQLTVDGDSTATTPVIVDATALAPAPAAAPEPVSPRPSSPGNRALWIAAVAIAAVVVLVIAIAAAGDDAPNEIETTTTSTTTQPTSTTAAPADTGALDAACAALEDEKQAIDAAKEQLEELLEDKDERSRRKKELEEDKKAIEAEERRAGC